jgi:hypothetical protein
LIVIDRLEANAAALEAKLARGAVTVATLDANAATLHPKTAVLLEKTAVAVNSLARLDAECAVASVAVHALQVHSEAENERLARFRAATALDRACCAACEPSKAALEARSAMLLA